MTSQIIPDTGTDTDTGTDSPADSQLAAAALAALTRLGVDTDAIRGRGVFARSPSDGRNLFAVKTIDGGGGDWVVSDPACCRNAHKVSRENPDDIWLAKSGFGGTEYLLSGLFSEGTKRGLGPAAVARLTSTNPAARYGLTGKGSLEVGSDADIALLDPSASWVVHAEDSPSSQGYTPFEGHELTGRVTDVWLRGGRILKDGNVVGEARGEYQRRGPGRG